MTINEYINRYIDEDFDVNSPLPFPIREKILPKGTMLIQYGEIERHAYFLKEGIVEIHIHNGKAENILEFITPFSFFCSYASLLTGLPSDCRVECVTNCNVTVVNQKDIIDAYRHSLIANKLGRYVTERLYLRRSTREKQLLNTSAEQRYIQFIASRPELVDIVPLYKVANYLGIHPESLSRIRKK